MSKAASDRSTAASGRAAISWKLMLLEDSDTLDDLRCDGLYIPISAPHRPWTAGRHRLITALTQSCERRNHVEVEAFPRRSGRDPGPPDTVGPDPVQQRQHH